MMLILNSLDKIFRLLKFSGENTQNTVKTVVLATSIKRDPHLSGHFNTGVLSTHLSNTSNGRQILSQTAQKSSLSGHFERPDLFASQQLTPVINFGDVSVFHWTADQIAPGKSSQKC